MSTANQIYDNIKFTRNWNNKFGCEFYTTIRLYNSRKYQLGRRYNVYFLGELIQQVECVALGVTSIDRISEHTCYTDCGLSKSKFVELMKRFYGNSVSDTSGLHIVVLKVVKRIS